MGVTKTEGYTEIQNRIAVIFKALGHPARIAILEYLIKSNQCICTDIVEELPLSQPAISRHLKVLKGADLIQGSIESNTICYCINKRTITEIEEYFGKLKKTFITSLNC